MLQNHTISTYRQSIKWFTWQSSGIVCMKALARWYGWWPVTGKVIDKKVQNSHSCQVHQNMPAAASIHPWENARLPWVRVHLDFKPPHHLWDLKLFTSKNSIKHITTAPYRSSSNVQHSGQYRLLRLLQKKNGNLLVDIHTVICRYLLSYHNTPQTSTNLSPAELICKGKLTSRLNLLKLQISKGPQIKKRVR